mgnify:FL=1
METNSPTIESFRIMTYNVRFDQTIDGPNQWDFRKDRFIGLIRYHAPDLFGVQEPLPNQIADLRAGLPEFNDYGVGRNDGVNDGEFNSIFYRSSRFELLDKGTFWLSETPDIPGSKGWDASYIRICTWVYLRDQYTNQKFYYFNTHFDHIGTNARDESARLLLTRIQTITGFTSPVLLTGDFNTGPDSIPYRILTTDTSLQDAKHLTETPHYGPDGTWATFFIGQGLGEQIDFIFITPQYIRVLKHAILTDSNNEYFPSDHLPVIAELLVKKNNE